MQKITAVLRIFHRPICIIVTTITALILSTSNIIPVLALCFIALFNWFEFDHIIHFNDKHYVVKSFSIRIKTFETFKEAYEYVAKSKIEIMKYRPGRILYENTKNTGLHNVFS